MSFRVARENLLRQRYYKKALDPEELKKCREDNSWSVRKKKREKALSKRRNITQISDCSEPTSCKNDPKLEDLPRYASEIRSGNPNTQYDAIYCVRVLLSASDNPPIEQVINLGIAKDLVAILSFSESAEIQFQSAWALTNIACGTSEQTNALLDYGAVPAFISILKGKYEEAVKDQAIWALGNIAADSTSFRDYILQQNVLDMLIEIITQSEGRLQVTGTWCVANLCKGKPNPPFDITYRVVPVLFSLLRESTREQVKGDACWAIAHLSDCSNPEQVKFLFDKGLIRSVLPLLSDASPKIHTPAVRVLGNVASGDDSLCEPIITGGALPMLTKLLQCSTDEIVLREICWTISNIAAGPPSQVQQVLDTNLLLDTLYQRSGQVPHSVQREIAWIITNLASGGSHEQIRFMVQLGAIQLLCDLLSVCDTVLLHIIIEGLEYIFTSGESIQKLSSSTNPYIALLEEAGGLKTLTQLTDLSSDVPLRQRILQFLDRFESDDEMEEEYLIPCLNITRKEFIFG